MKKYQFALDQYAIVSTVDINGKIIEVNDKFCEISGFSRDELIGDHHGLINSGYHSPNFFTDLWKTISQGHVWHGEIKNKKKSGECYWISQTIVPVLNSKKDCYEYIAIDTDISAQKQHQKQLLDNWHFMEKVTSTMAQGVYVLNVKGECTFWNKEAENILGWSAEDLLNHNLHQLIHYQDEQGNAIATKDCPTLKSIQNKQPYSSEAEVFTHKEGHIVPISITSVPLLENNEIIGSVAIFNDISVRKKNEELLNSAMMNAQQASQAKSDFLANMSHEIRTPMNGIIGMTDLALETELTDEQREYLEIVKESSCSLLAIINDILDFSQIDAGNIVLEQITFQPEKLIKEILLTADKKARKKGLTLVTEMDVLSNIPSYLMGDPKRLRQILINLLDNAIKFTSEGEIKLSLIIEDHDKQSCHLLFTVSDTGIGIEENKQATIFESFLQADSSVLRKFGGTGLGLSISKQLVEMMGGKIWLESQEGKGSHFSFTSHFQYDPTYMELNLEHPLIHSNTTQAPKISSSFIDNEDLMICNWDAIIKRLGGLEIVNIVVEMFFEEYEDYINNIKQALASKNATTLKNELHTLKGVCSAIGAERVEQLIKIAEIKVQEQALAEFDELVTLVNEIEHNIDKLTLYLKQKLKKL